MAETPGATRSKENQPVELGFVENQIQYDCDIRSNWRETASQRRHTIDFTVAPANFQQPPREETIPQPTTQPSYLDSSNESPAQGPSYLEPPEDGAAEVAQPSYLDPGEEELPMSREFELLRQRVGDLETYRSAQEDATRQIIAQSLAKTGPNINQYVVFGGTLETLTFWAEDFDGVAESDIVLDTVELDFEIQVNPWTVGSIVFEYIDGTDFLFPTTEGDEIAVDRFNVDTAFITVGDTTKYPLFATFGRVIVPFGISTGDPVADVLTINDPLTVEVFETREDVVLIGFEWPTQPPPPPTAPNPPPPPPQPRPLLINPLVRRVAHSVCKYCGPPLTPATPPPYIPPACVPPFSGAIYFYNGDTIDGFNQEDHIEHMGGTLGYRTRGIWGGVPWTLDVDCDVNSSVFDSNFLEFEYRAFLEQIGYVPGLAAHAKSNIGPVALVLEWNGALTQADFIDDAGQAISIAPQAWQFALGYQFDWNPSVEIIGAQGTYLAIGYSESRDLAGVTRLVGDPVLPTVLRVGSVPERRFSIGVGEWVLEGLRVALEYSHVVDYEESDGGTGNSANGFFWQMTYEW